jgi:hypothetical protein
MFYDAQSARVFDPAEITCATETGDHEETKLECESVEPKAQDFARMCRAYETGERIYFNFENFDALSITRSLELLRNNGLLVHSLELQSRTVKHRSFDSFIVLVRQQTESRFGARSASFRMSLSYCRQA